MDDFNGLQRDSLGKASTWEVTVGSADSADCSGSRYSLRRNEFHFFVLSELAAPFPSDAGTISASAAKTALTPVILELFRTLQTFAVTLYLLVCFTSMRDAMMSNCVVSDAKFSSAKCVMRSSILAAH